MKKALEALARAALHYQRGRANLSDLACAARDYEAAWSRDSLSESIDQHPIDVPRAAKLGETVIL